MTAVVYEVLQDSSFGDMSYSSESDDGDVETSTDFPDEVQQ